MTQLLKKCYFCWVLYFALAVIRVLELHCCLVAEKCIHTRTRFVKQNEVLLHLVSISHKHLAVSKHKTLMKHPL